MDVQLSRGRHGDIVLNSAVFVTNSSEIRSPIACADALVMELLFHCVFLLSYPPSLNIH